MYSIRIEKFEDGYAAVIYAMGGDGSQKLVGIPLRGVPKKHNVKKQMSSVKWSFIYGLNAMRDFLDTAGGRVRVTVESEERQRRQRPMPLSRETNDAKSEA